MDKKIIYFIDGMFPSEDEKLEAQSFGVATVFRNSQYIFDDLEKCDAVAGVVIPEPYKDYPTADELVDSIAEAMEAAKERMRLRKVGAATDTPPNTNDQNQSGASSQWGKNK